MTQFDEMVDKIGTGTALVPTTPQVYPSPRRRLSPEANFLSQLIAERYRLAPQRTRRRAALSDAVGAYATGSRIAVIRMPAGYRTTIDA